MAQPVWVLSVDLQTKTATFQSGMADAARSARESFTEIKSGAGEMGRATSGSMMEARHGVMLLGEEFGLHLPRGVTTFLASLGPVGAAMEAAFPFLAIAVGATFLIEKLMKIEDEAGKSGQAWTAISDDVAKWGENSKKELLDVQIQLDKLNGDKLKELADTLKRLDLTTLDHLKGEFDGVGKKVDETFAKMRSNSFMTFIGMGNGVADVQQMFASAMDKINADLAKGDQKKLASDLKEAGDQMWNLAAPTYDLVQRLHEANNEWGANKISADEHYQALLKAHGVMVSMTDELVRQQTIEKDQAGLATQTITPVHNATDPRIAEERRKQLAAYMETNKQKAESDAKLDEARVQMEASVTHFFAEEYKKQTDEMQRAAQQQHESAERANDEAVKDAESARKISQMGVQASAYVQSKQKEQADIRAILQREQSDLIAAHQREIAEQQAYISKMNDLAASSTGAAQVNATNEATAAQTKLTAATRQFNEEMARNKAAIQASELETAKLNNSWAVFFAQANHETMSLAATIRGELQSSMQQATDTFAKGIAKSLVEGKSFGKEMMSVARQMSESMIEGLIRWGMQDLITKMGMKATAATLAGANATASMAAAPWPVDMGAPAFGASMLGAAMALETGGIVPGVGNKDTVPAMLTPGEAVLPKNLTDNLRSASRSGSSGNGPEVHIHHSPTYHVQTIDGDGIKQVLTEHAEQFHQHVENHIRKMNG
jgi:hypothetical protein